MVHHNYIPTNYKTRVDLKPHEIERDKIDDHLLKRLKSEYEGRTIKDGNVMGYIRKGSLKLVDRGRGFMVGSHFTGTLCFNVIVNFDLYTPVLNKVVEARVLKITPIGFSAEALPLRIIVSRTTTFDQSNASNASNVSNASNASNAFQDLFQNIQPDLQIPIEILHYELRAKYIYAVGRLKPFEEIYSKSFDIEVDSIGDFNTFIPEPIYIETIPAQNEDYGDPKELIDNKNELSDPDDPDKVLYWEYYIKEFLNDYEIIGNNDYFQNDLILSVSPMPFSRAYYKLIEILKDEEILRNYEDISMNVLFLNAVPGGFIQAMIDARPNSKDKLIGQTPPINSFTGVERDWTNLPNNARDYMEKHKSQISLEINDLTDPSNIRKMINTLSDGSESVTDDRWKMHIITADGGVDVEKNNNYNYQEEVNYKLIYAEILTALACQATNGHLILKIYDIYTNVTNQFIHLLGNMYEILTIIKPKTSRPANSERYIVCKDFRGLDDFPIDLHLDQLQKWNELDHERHITPLTPYLDRNFYVTSLILINLSPDVTTKIKEKNQLYVKRQLENLKKGLNILTDLRRDDEQEKYKILYDRMYKQIQNATAWCNEYLQKCRTGIQKPNLTYYQTSHGPKNHKLVPFLRETRSTKRS